MIEKHLIFSIIICIFIKIEIANGLIVNSPTNIINKTILKWQTTTRHSVDSAS